MPDGKRIEFGATATAFDGTDLPGTYQLEVNGGRTPIAVNIPPGESDTSPLARDELAQWGAKMGAPPKTAIEKTLERRRQSEDLEKQQKLWRWIILCVLGLLGIETLLAGRLARRATLQRGRDMNDQNLRVELERVSARYRRLVIWRAMGAVWLLLALACATIMFWVPWSSVGGSAAFRLVLRLASGGHRRNGCAHGPIPACACPQPPVDRPAN